MPITSLWDNDEQTIALQVFEGRWTWNDLYAASDRSVGMMNSVGHPVDFILDLRKGALLPSDALKHVKHLGDLMTQMNNSSAIVLVGGNLFIRAFWDTFSKIYGAVAKQMDIRFVGTMEEARQLIATYRQAGQG